MAEQMIEVVIDSIRVSLMSQQRIVILREINTERYLPIWIGVYEAEAITIALQEVEVSRPLTHDLLKNVFNVFNAHILRIEVTSLKDDTFYGNIIAEMNGQIINIDSRPSDALNLAVRAHVPIFVAKSVMDTAGVVPEKDLQQEHPSPLSTTPQTKKSPIEETSESDDRLSIFEDFLEKLDLDDSSDQDDEDKEE